MAQKKLDLLQFAAGKVHNPAHVRAKIVACEVLDSDLYSGYLDLCQRAFGVILSPPQTFPSRLTRRRSAIARADRISKTT
jgi:hypothetical protein